MNLESPTWQGIGALLTAAGVFVAIVIYLLQKPKRKISYYVSDPQPLLNQAASATHNIEILSKGIKLNDPRWVTLRVQNSGRTEIEKSDFSEPLLLTFGAHAKLHSSVVRSTTPDNFQISLLETPSSLTVQPLLLNRGDAFEIQCLLTDMNGDPMLNARIRGISKLTRISRAEYLGVGKIPNLEMASHLLAVVFAGAASMLASASFYPVIRDAILSIISAK